LPLDLYLGPDFGRDSGSWPKRERGPVRIDNGLQFDACSARFLAGYESGGPILANFLCDFTAEDSRTMSERIEEAKGSIKENVGRMTGNSELEAEGRAERDTAHAKRQVKGAANQAKGSIEENLGKVTGDDETRARGVADRLKGDSQRTG
jgi:uncharacterized protein YjbJ (UPF0337 family)